ncbi:DUF1702 family protein [Actinocorallia sp. A-T 12471]|uniref:DUF1702 family protein n=1 Tax=Actinocorallia sp. A-T 12471 TaxID=3089813 RepID=UPI0029D06F56|nr:DUF1702 family protein [Actinocorallia sp. A-T 12471]MDX6741604.1 DUF1702 family protein [Actinocorallia sp. A-T 12471]
MPSPFGSLLRLALTPSFARIGFAARGFPSAGTPAAAALEEIPQSVIAGFEWGIDTREQWELERRLSLVAPELRGFAYEGATMACTVRDAMPGRGGRTRALLRGPGAPHIFLAYIGIGFAMARLPRPLWKNVMPDLSGSPYYPAMTWLAVDGYGFDRAYFETRTWVDEQKVPAPYAWEGDADYFPRAVDQGIGRALWFIHGARPRAVADAIGAFAEHRRADLWSGAGLAATFAGGCAPRDLAAFRAVADGLGHGPQVAQGAVFAARARAFSGHVAPHSAEALEALTGLTVERAVALADGAAVDPAESHAVPAYEIWRGRVRAHFTEVPIG